MGIRALRLGWHHGCKLHTRIWMLSGLDFGEYWMTDFQMSSRGIRLNIDHFNSQNRRKLSAYWRDIFIGDGFSVGHLVKEDRSRVRDKADGNCRRIQSLSVAKSFLREIRTHQAAGWLVCSSCCSKAVGAVDRGKVLETHHMYALNVQHHSRMQLRVHHFFSPGRSTINLSGVFFKWLLCAVIKIS